MDILIGFIIFIVGTVFGGLVVLKYEEETLTTMLDQCASLAALERELREERERYIRKIEVSSNSTASYGELEEDYSEIYN